MRQLSVLIFLLLLGICVPSSYASGSQELLNFETEQQRRTYAQLTAELRCPQCQNQNIADSNAVVAVDMREKTHELVLQGYSRQQVLDYMIDRYGNFVHYKPPVNYITIWLWLLPALMLVLLLVFQLTRRRAAPSSATDIAEPAAVGQKEALNQQLDQIIERYRSKNL